MLNGVDPQAYLTDLLTRLVNGWLQARIDELIPWHWATPKGGCFSVPKHHGCGALLTACLGAGACGLDPLPCGGKPYGLARVCPWCPFAASPSG